MFFAGLAQGFNEAQTADRQLQAQKDEANAARENSVLNLIATQHPDDDVRAQALATLMTPRTAGSGLGKFFNAAQKNPMLPTLQALMRSGKPMQGNVPGGPTGVPEPGVTTGPNPEGEAGSAALPARSLVAPVAGPPSAAGPAPTPSVSRVGLLSPEERAYRLEAAQSRGKIEGTLQGVEGGFPSASTGNPEHDAALKQLVKAKALGLTPVHSYDNEGNLHISLGDQEVAMVPGAGKSASPEAKIETDAQNLLAAGKAPTIEEARMLARTGAAGATTATQTTAGNRATITTAQAGVAPAMADARLQQVRQRILNEQATLTGTRLSNELKTRVLNGQLTGVEALRFAGQFFANRPGATTDEVNEVVAALTAGNTPVGGGGRVGGGRAAAATPPPGGGASVGAAAAAPPGAGTPPAKGAGAVTAKPTGAVLPPGKSMYKPNASEQGTLDTIAAAGPMMERVRALIKGKEADNSWGSTLHAAGQALPPMIGRNPSDPVYQELQPLIQHLKVFALGPYLHGIRNGAFVKSVSDNTPTELDTPAHITAKLNNLEQNFADIRAAVGSKAGGAAGGPAGAAPPQPTYAWDANGVRHVQTDPNATLPAGWTTTPPRK